MSKKKKKRTKSKKSSGSQTQARRAEKATSDKQDKVAVEAKAEETTEVEETEEVEETTEEKVETSSKKSKKKKTEKKKKEVNPNEVALQRAVADFGEGRYRDAREKLVTLLDSNPSPEQKEQAHELLGNMEMDVRTLMVGAVAMVTLLLIPTLGYTNFAKALWTIPVLFLLLIVDPRLFRSPGSAASDES